MNGDQIIFLSVREYSNISVVEVLRIKSTSIYDLDLSDILRRVWRMRKMIV